MTQQHFRFENIEYVRFYPEFFLYACNTEYLFLKKEVMLLFILTMNNVLCL